MRAVERGGPAADRAGAGAPRIVVNAKAYAEVTGAAGCLRLARACARVADATGVAIAFAPPAVELASLARRRPSLGLPLFGQHCDAREPGAATGWLTAEALAAAGAVGSLVNHAEHKLPHGEVAKALARLENAGIASLACADSLAEATALAAFKPALLAIEPPELIGGDVSVTTADPAIVSDAVKAVRKVAPKTLVLCGAGVKTGADVAAAIRLGAHGVLLASGVVKAKDPVAALKDLAAPLTPPSLRAR
ncbi:MAG: triosephosphate isomerase [Thermoplasmata archaeon]|jgi:triosephosphate isomerase|nr:triosephosphate isomerase [Thermoplasmata archaeon]